MPNWIMLNYSIRREAWEVEEGDLAMQHCDEQGDALLLLAARVHPVKRLDTGGAGLAQRGPREDIRTTFLFATYPHNSTAPIILVHSQLQLASRHRHTELMSSRIADEWSD